MLGMFSADTITKLWEHWTYENIQERLIGHNYIKHTGVLPAWYTGMTWPCLPIPPCICYVFFFRERSLILQRKDNPETQSGSSIILTTAYYYWWGFQSGSDPIRQNTWNWILPGSNNLALSLSRVQACPGLVPFGTYWSGLTIRIWINCKRNAKNTDFCNRKYW